MQLLKTISITAAPASPHEFAWKFWGAFLWLCDLDDADHPAWAIVASLTAGERARVLRLKQPAHRRRFTARCSFVVRRVLRKFVGLAPRTIKFRIGLPGKPELAAGDGARAPLRSNVSRSENFTTLAVAFDQEVGVDIEIVRRDLDFPAVASTQFGAEEAERLRALPTRERPVSFYRLRTRHEALTKASGRRINSPAFSTREPKVRWMVNSFECQFGGRLLIGSLVLGNFGSRAREGRLAD